MAYRFLLCYVLLLLGSAQLSSAQLFERIQLGFSAYHHAPVSLSGEGFSRVVQTSPAQATLGNPAAAGAFSEAHLTLQARYSTRALASDDDSRYGLQNAPWPTAATLLLPYRRLRLALGFHQPYASSYRGGIPLQTEPVPGVELPDPKFVYENQLSQISLGLGYLFGHPRSTALTLGFRLDRLRHTGSYDSARADDAYALYNWGWAIGASLERAGPHPEPMRLGLFLQRTATLRGEYRSSVASFVQLPGEERFDTTQVKSIWPTQAGLGLSVPLSQRLTVRTEVLWSGWSAAKYFVVSERNMREERSLDNQWGFSATLVRRLHTRWHLSFGVYQQRNQHFGRFAFDERRQSFTMRYVALGLVYRRGRLRWDLALADSRLSESEQQRYTLLQSSVALRF